MFSCAICCRIKPRFYRSITKEHMCVIIWSLEHGPLPSSFLNKYLLVAIDECSRFSYIFPCKDLSADTATNCLTFYFQYSLTDQGTSFMYLFDDNFCWTVYFHQSNNHFSPKVLHVGISKTVQLALANRNLPINLRNQPCVMLCTFCYRFYALPLIQLHMSVFFLFSQSCNMKWYSIMVF